jgi:hypothetical protein
MQTIRYAMIMAVMVPREKWTDERLDDLQEEMREGFARIDADIRELRQELKNLNRNLMGGLVVVLAAIIGSNVF